MYQVNQNSNNNNNNNSSKFKTLPCRFYSLGKCTKGEECSYIHDENNLAVKPTPPMPTSFKSAAVERSSPCLDCKSTVPRQAGLVRCRTCHFRNQSEKKFQQEENDHKILSLLFQNEYKEENDNDNNNDNNTDDSSDGGN